nr:methyltransferase domain-containing protein [Clostridium saccharoperbutylacetonicum]
MGVIKVKIIQRDRCIVTEKKDLEHLYTFENFPIHMGVTDNSEYEDVKCDMIFMISKSSGMIQLKNLIPLDFLYTEEHYNSIGQMWEKHHKEFAEFIRKFNPKAVFEIGGARGILEKFYNENSEVFTPWTILEPVPNPIEGCRAHFVKNFFDKNYNLEEHSFDVLVHSHLLEHIYDPDEFIFNISSCLNDGKIMCFSVPNLKEILKRKYTNVLNFEHTYFLTKDYIEYLCNKHRLKLIEYQYFEEDHSIFFACIKDNCIKPIRLRKELYIENKLLYKQYITEHESIVSNYNKIIDETDRPIYIFGAHVFTQYIISFGLNIEKIVCILDNDSQKQGRRLSGTNLKVNSPIILKDVKESPIVILRAGVHSREIKRDILENINPNTVFLE